MKECHVNTHRRCYVVYVMTMIIIIIIYPVNKLRPLEIVLYEGGLLCGIAIGGNKSERLARRVMGLA